MSAHKGRSVELTFGGRTLTIGQWAEETGLSRPALFGRLYRQWPLEEALTVPATSKAKAHRRTPRIDSTTPYALDREAQRLVREHPQGMTLDEVGVALGITRERVRQIEHRAVEKLRIAAERRYGERAAAMRVLRHA